MNSHVISCIECDSGWLSQAPMGSNIWSSCKHQITFLKKCSKFWNSPHLWNFGCRTWPAWTSTFACLLVCGRAAWKWSIVDVLGADGGLPGAAALSIPTSTGWPSLPVQMSVPAFGDRGYNYGWLSLKKIFLKRKLHCTVIWLTEKLQR